MIMTKVLKVIINVRPVLHIFSTKQIWWCTIKVGNNQNVLMWLCMDNLYYWTVMLSKHFWEVTSSRGENLRPKLQPGDGFFGLQFFIIFKNTHQDLSNEGSNFILSQVEVGHRVAQTYHFLTNSLKLQILASYNNLRIQNDSEFDRYWPRALQM